jgi:hypothetical protein
MEILSRDQINDLIDIYEYKDTLETFFKKVVNKFPLTDEEIHLAYLIIDRMFIRGYS